MNKYLLLIPSLFFCFFCTSLMGMAQIDESSVERTLVVDPSGNGDYVTIGDAFQFLNMYPEMSVKVLIKPGIYREGALKLAPRTASATIIEGEVAGEVFISGSDVWDQWTHEGDGLYSTDWRFDWGEAAYDDYYKIKNNLGRRSEIVLLDDERMTQVASKDELPLNGYYVDEANNLLWIKLEDGSAIAEGRIEVSTRGGLFWLRQVSNLVLRNLNFINASSSSNRDLNNRWAVAIFGGSATGDMNDFENHTKHLLIDNCSFTSNNSAGPTIASYQNILITDCHFDDNGNAGAGINRIRYATIQNSTFNRNNWRVGGYGRFFDWAPAGTKILFADSLTIRNCEFNENMATGLWMDYHNENILIDNIVANDNYGPGIYLEASTGPFVVSNSEIRRNAAWQGGGLSHGGILIAESRLVTITDNVIEDNCHGQIMIRTREREGSGGFFSGDRFDGSVKDITIVNNQIAGKVVVPDDEVINGFFTEEKHDGGMIMMTSHGNTEWYQEFFLPTLWVDNNTYSHENGNPLFSTGGNYGFERIPFAEWQTRYNLDASSSVIDYQDTDTASTPRSETTEEAELQEDNPHIITAFFRLIFGR